MSKMQLIETIRAARLTEREKQSAVAALATADHLVDAFDRAKEFVASFGARRISGASLRG